VFQSTFRLLIDIEYVLGFESDDADFGNTFAEQNLQFSYAQQGGRANPRKNGDKKSGGKRGGGGQQMTDGITMLRKSLPGIPGQDYPIYGEIPETSFSCDGQVRAKVC